MRSWIEQPNVEMLRKALAIAGLNPPTVTLPEDREIIVGNMRFHYLDWGGNGYPLLFLHGGGLTAHTWDVMAVNLRDRFRCIALDQRGHGDSEWSPTIDYGVETQVKDVEGFIADARPRPARVDRPIDGWPQLDGLRITPQRSGQSTGGGGRRPGNQSGRHASHPRVRQHA